MERKSRSRDCCHHFAPENSSGRLLCPSQGQVVQNFDGLYILSKNGQYLNIIHRGWWYKFLMQSRSSKNNYQQLYNAQKRGNILLQGSSAQAVMWSEVWSWQPPGDHSLSMSAFLSVLESNLSALWISKNKRKKHSGHFIMIMNLRQMLIGRERTSSWQGLNSGSLMALTVTWWDKIPLINSLDPNWHKSGCKEQVGWWGTRLLFTHLLPRTQIQQIWSPAKVIVYAKTDPSGKPAHGITAFIVEEHFPGFHKGNRHNS